MRLIPGKTKVQIELFKGVTLWDILVGGIAMGLAILVIISSLEGKVVFLSIVLFFAVLLILRLDTQPNYVMLLHMFQHFGFVRRYRKVYDDETLKKKAKNELVDDYLKEYREEHADDNAAEEDANYGDSAEYDDAQGDGTEEDRITNGYESYESDTYENGDSYDEEPYETESYETDIPYEASYSGDDGFYEDDEFLAYHDDDTQVLENTSKVKGLDKKSGAKKSKKAKNSGTIKLGDYHSDDENADGIDLGAGIDEDFGVDVDFATTDVATGTGAKIGSKNTASAGDGPKKSLSELKKEDKRLRKEEDKILRSSKYTKEEKDAVWLARANRSQAIKQAKNLAKEDVTDNTFQAAFMDQIMAFTGIKDGYIEYGGKYFGCAIEIDPVEFRFFSEHRRNNSIEAGVGRVLRGVHVGFSANIVKIERPVMYDKFLEKEEQKLIEIRKSFESGVMSEAEFKGRVEIVEDRIADLKDMCFHNKIITPFYYLVLFESDKKQLEIQVKAALDYLTAGELKVKRLESDKELAVFLKYTNQIDFDEREIDLIDPEDYAMWAMPTTLNIKFRTIEVNNIITHNMRVVTYPTMVGDAWLAGVMSMPGTKVVVKCTPMDRGKSVRTIDRSLQELRGQYNATGVDSKRIELETHIASLTELLATLQSEGEELMECNIYITAYDIQATRTSPAIVHQPPESVLPVISSMKKNVRRAWQESGFRLNNMEFEQIQAFIGSQVSAYDPKEKEGRGIPTNSIAAAFPWIYAHISDEGGFKLGVSEGVPVFINFFRRDNERVNSNMVVIGKSGSGKSYATKSLLSNLAAEDAKIFILDPENEYSELAHNLHGKMINVANALQGRLNPFHIITALDDDEAGGGTATGSFATHLQFLEEFYRQILPDIDKDALEYLNTLTERLYTNRGITPETELSKLAPEDYPVFDDLYDAVLQEFERTDNEYIRSLLRSLINYVSKFSTGGRNANIWNGPSTVTTEENFTVFNFQSMLSNRNTTIANAQMLLVLKYIDNEIIKNRDYNTKYKLNRKVVVVIDEAHVFIDEKYPIALDFMFQLAKRIRKYNGMQIVITQNIKDFVGSEEIARKSTAIINACQYSFIFALAPNDIQDLCKLYEKAGGINENEQEQITQAPRGQAFTIMSPTSRSTFRVEVPKNMVDMFQESDYESKRFSGEEGEAVWEDFIGESRALNEEARLENKRAEEIESEYISANTKQRVIFEEIAEEEEPEIYTIGTKGKTHSGSVSFDFEEETEVPGMSGGVSFEEESDGFSFEEVTEDPSVGAAVMPGLLTAQTTQVAETTTPVVQPVATPVYVQQPVYAQQPQMIQPAGGGITVSASDYNSMVESIRSSVLREVRPEISQSAPASADYQKMAEDLRSQLLNEIMQELKENGAFAGMVGAGSVAAGAAVGATAAAAAAASTETPASEPEDIDVEDTSFADLFGGGISEEEQSEDFGFDASSYDDDAEIEDTDGSDASDFDDMDFSLLFSGADMPEDESTGDEDSDEDDFDIMALLRTEAASHAGETEINDIDEIVGEGEVTEITLSELAALVRLQREQRRHRTN